MMFLIHILHSLFQKLLERQIWYLRQLLIIMAFSQIWKCVRRFKNHNIQNRTVALVENGTWGPLANKQMKEIVEGMKNMTILDETVTIKSSLKESQMDTLDSMAKAIYESMK